MFASYYKILLYLSKLLKIKNMDATLNISRVKLADALAEAGLLKDEFVFKKGRALAKISYILDEILNDPKIKLMDDIETTYKQVTNK